MALLRSEHCGQPEPHRSHHGRLVHHLAGPGPHLVCDGDPAHLARQLEREANPPPGPPAPPQRIEWQPSGQEVCRHCRESVFRPPIGGLALVTPTDTKPLGFVCDKSPTKSHEI